MTRIKELIGGSLLAAALTGAGSTPSRAYDHNFWLWNNSDRTIIGAWLSTQNDTMWHPISGDVIDPGDKSYISFEDQGAPCQVQLKVKFADGETATFTEGFNVCRISDIAVHFNNSVRNYEAVYR